MKNASLAFSLLVLAAFGIGYLKSRASGSEPGPRRLSVAAPEPGLPPLAAPPSSGSLALRIVGEIDETALADVCVELRSGEQLFWGFTDDSGSIEFDRLQPGAQRVTVLARGRAPHEVTLQTGSELQTIVLQAPPAEARRLPSIERAPVAGRLAPVLDVNLGGYHVVFQPQNSADVFGGEVPRRAVCDAGGAFRIDDLALGRYQIQVRPPWASSGAWPELVDSEHAFYEHSAEHLVLAPSLTSGAITGDVLDGRGHAVRGALVLVREARDPARVWPPVATDDRGRFRVRDLPPGGYVVEVRAGEGASEIEVAVERGQLAHVEVPPLALREAAPRAAGPMR